MASDDNKAVARSLIEDAWNKNNPSLLDDLIATDGVLAVARELPKGPAGFKDALNGDSTAFPDDKITIVAEVAEGDTVVQRVSRSGTNTGPWAGRQPTGKTRTINGVIIYKIKGGKIAEAWPIFDQLAQLQQLGVIPTNP